MSPPPWCPEDIFRGPTTGREPRSWGYAFELAIEQPFRLTPQQCLTSEDAARLAKRMRHRKETVFNAFRSLLCHGLLIVQQDEAGFVAMPDQDALRHLLSTQQGLKQAGTGQQGLAALSYFDSQRFRVRAPWLRHVLGDREEFQQ